MNPVFHRMFKSKYVHVNTPELLAQMDKFLMNGDKANYDLAAFDTETNGLLIFRNVVIGFSISTDSKSGFYVPFLEWVRDESSRKVRKIDGVETEVFLRGHFKCVWTGKEYPETVTSAEYQPPEFIKDYMRRWLLSMSLLMHNAPFDCNMMFYNYDIDITDNLFCDTRLLKHFIDESTKTGLKETAILWARELGFDAERAANQEQIEMGASVIRNGGSKGHIWRGDWDLVSKYACADTALTFGLFEVGSEKLQSDYGDRGVELFYEKEMMPLCREVVIPMQRGGVKISVEHFENLKKELQGLIDRFEDQAQAKMSHLLEDFDKGDSLEEAVSQRRLLDRIIEIEGLPYPEKVTKKRTGEVEIAKSLAKPAVKKAHAANPHWLWGYILGEDEMKYSEARLKEIKNDLYREVLGRRYRFNLGSDMHLRWLLFDKLGNDKKSVPQTDSATPENPIPSCAADVLEEHFKARYDFIEDVMMFRKLGDLLGNYVEKAITLHNKGWLHMDMDQAGTTSGRFSCRGGFNLQTLPKVESLSVCPHCESKKVEIKTDGTVLAEIHCQNCKKVTRNIICYSVVKQGFVAPEGYKIINADYSSLEPRCFAFMSGDKKLKDIYFKDLDLYAKIYCDIEDEEGRYSPDPKMENFLKKKNPALRDMVKPVVLGIPYGARGPQVANLMGFRKKIKDRKTGLEKEILDVERGIAWREKYLGTYEDLHNYMEECEISATTKGYVETVIGRRRHYKYAPIIQKILDQRSIDRETFLDCRARDLEKTQIDLGDGLDEEDLEWFSEQAGMYLSQVKEKGCWAYIRGLYKNELDNAKNVRIQGLAGHICNRGMLDTTRYFRENGIDGYVCLQVHDEITCYVREDQAEFGAALLQIGMEDNEFAKVVDIGMKAEPLICDNLKDSK